ncbi:MAG TPA: ABC transporter ATP-binding protein [Gaiellaceae bacterium]|jgi:ATP-binding cassette subfamily B protein|nr:ABC transporter ATP-binding protein [Gaiellaceae bacterium]
MREGEARRRAAWRFVRAVVRSQAGGVVGAVVFGLLWQTGAVAAPLIVKYAIDHAIVPRDRHALLLWLLALLGVGLLEVAGGGMRHIFAIRNRAGSDARVRDAIFAHALRLDAAYHDRVGPGELMSRASSDSEQVARMMDSIGHTIGYALTVVAVAAVMLAIDARLALVVLIPLPFVSLVAWRYSLRYDARTRRLQEAWAEAATLVEESVSGIRVVKGLGAGTALSGRFRRRSDEIVRRALEVARVDAVFNPALETLPLLGIAAVLWFGGRRVAAGDLSLGSFVAFNAYVVMLVWPLRILGQRVSTLQKALAAGARITEVLETEPRLREARHPRELARPVRGNVRLEAVRFGHAGERPVLDGLDLHVARGESVALVGATGSGKSTVAGLLARLYDPDGGRVLLDGVDLRELRLADVRRAVALVFEETFLFSDTVRENIRFGRPEADDDAVARAAELAGAAAFVADLPDGYDTVLGERGFSLSGGQRQRVAIARALLADPAVLVLDDATSAVDATKEHEIRAALAQAMRGRTTIVIAHRPATIALADRVAVLEDGRIADEDTHAELIRRSARYRALLALETEAA